MNDDQIIELYNKRDENAIRETAQKYGNYCFGIANNILSNKQDSEECVNDTYLRTWNSIPPQRPSSLRLYLAKIVRNLSFNRYKERNRDKRGGGEISIALYEIEEFVEGTSRVESELEEQEFIKAFNRFLYSLPHRERYVFVRRYFYVNSTAEIAERYKISEGNVLTILSRTRKKLKQYLEKEGYTI